LAGKTVCKNVFFSQIENHNSIIQASEELAVCYLLSKNNIFHLDCEYAVVAVFAGIVGERDPVASRV